MIKKIKYEKWGNLTTDRENQLTRFLESIPGFHYFQSPQFFNVCLASKKLTPYYIIAGDQGAIVGCMLFFKQIQVSFPLASFLSSRTIIWGGPVVSGNSIEVADGLLSFYKRNCPLTIYTQVRNLVDTSLYQDGFIKSGFQYEDHLNIIVDLTLSEDDLWKNVHTKRRNQIRRSEKEGCLVDHQNSIDALKASFCILEEVYQRAKLPLPGYSHFESILTRTDGHSGLRLFTVNYEGKIIGCMLCLVQGDWLFDYYAGAYSGYYKKYPNDLLPWAVFRWAKKNGYTRFDFGGAGKPDVPYGVRDYKKQFGGEMVCFGRYEKLHFPNTFTLLKKVFAIWQRLKK